MIIEPPVDISSGVSMSTKENMVSYSRLVLICVDPQRGVNNYQQWEGREEEHLDSDVIQAAPEILQATASQATSQNRIYHWWGNRRSAAKAAGFRNQRTPAMSSQHLVFSHACLIWQVLPTQCCVIRFFSEEHKIFITTAVEILWQITSCFIIFLVVFQVRLWDPPFQKRKKKSLFSKRLMRATSEDYLTISTATLLSLSNSRFC